MFQYCFFTAITSVSKDTSSLKKTVRLGGRFHTPVVDNAIKLPYLRTTPGTQKQKGQKRYPI